MKIEVKNFSKAEEVREFPNGQLELVKVGGALVGRATFKPGWKWSQSLGPVMKTQSCQAAHLGYQISGVLVTRMDDGTEVETKAGDVLHIAPGHDAWVVGKEPVVVLDFQGMTEYGKKG